MEGEREEEFKEYFKGTIGDWDYEVFPGGDYSKY